MGPSLSSGTKKKADPAEEAKQWKRNLSKEMRKLDRDIAEQERNEKKAAVEIKKLAKINQLSKFVISY
jgi:hypothetical protein